MERSIWYAAPHQRVLTVVSAAKTPSFREQLRCTTHPRYHTVHLSITKRLSPIKQYAWNTESNACISLCNSKYFLCYPYYVAGSSGQLVRGRYEAKMGPRNPLHGGSVDVQTGALRFQARHLHFSVSDGVESIPA